MSGGGAIAMQVTDLRASFIAAVISLAAAAAAGVQ